MVTFSNIRIVLENPKSGKNVGAVCRAMKNMGFSRLYIAGTTEVDMSRAAVTAIHAFDLLETAVFCTTVEEALAGTAISAAVSRRRGKKRKSFSVLPEDFARTIIQRYKNTPGTPTDNTDDEIAIVFGNEVSGLNDHDLALCNTAVRIPSSEAFPSLNLSHAVQIITYEIYREALRNETYHGYRAINREELDTLTEDITENLKSIGFFKRVDDSDMRMFLRDFFARAAISAGEAKRFKKIFTKIRGLAVRNAGAGSEIIES